jgi:uncharacterized protein (TIGR03067 family)
MRPYALLLCLLIGSIAWAAEPSPEPDDDDAKKILGTWELVKAERDGKPPPGDEVKGLKIEITKDQLIITTTGNARKDMAGYRLDVKSKPRSIDITIEGDQMVKGIYKFDKGELTMCCGKPGTQRPTKFDDKTGSLMVLRKAKATK